MNHTERPALLTCLLLLAVVVGSAPAFAQDDLPLPPPLPEELPHVRVVATGGTIAGRASSREAGAGYESGALPIEELLEDLPGLDRVAEVTAEQFINVPSTAVDPEHWLGLAQRIELLLRDGIDGRPVDGVVVTHGTDALEETAYFLDLAVRSDRPVVVVGAMRPPGTVSADGSINLIQAVQTAAAPASRGRGTLIVLNEEIHDARDATKTHTRAVDTFRSRSWGPLGVVARGQVTYYRRSEKRQGVASEFDVTDLTPEDLPRVDILYSYNGADGVAAHALAAAGAAAIVIAGSGGGGTSMELGMALRELGEEKLWVVRTSRTGSGSVGSWGRGRFIGADDLLPQKARILMMLALTRSTDAAEIQRMFSEY